MFGYIHIDFNTLQCLYIYTHNVTRRRSSPGETVCTTRKLAFPLNKYCMKLLPKSSPFSNCKYHWNYMHCTFDCMKTSYQHGSGNINVVIFYTTHFFNITKFQLVTQYTAKTTVYSPSADKRISLPLCRFIM